MKASEIAAYWLAQGVAPIPVLPMSKRAAVKWLPYQHMLPRADRIAAWFSKRRDYNVGLICTDRRVVLDFDDLISGRDWQRQYPVLADTYTVATARGLHVYLNVDTPIKTDMNSEAVQLKASGYVLAAGSRHPSGAVYTTSVNRPIARVPSAVVLKSLTQYVEVSRPTSPDKVTGVVDRSLSGRAGRFSGDDLIAAIKSRITVMDILRRYTTPRKSSADGVWWLMRCPNDDHEDKSPSFWAKTSTDYCGCLSPRCKHTQPGNGRAMDVINLYSWLTGLANDDAIRELYEWVADPLEWGRVQVRTAGAWSLA